MIKNFAATAISLLVAVPVAQAADVGDAPFREPTQTTAPREIWNGFYAGAQAARSSGTSRNESHDADNDNSDPLSLPYALEGSLAGGVVGYNWQKGSLVVGLEGSYNWAKISGKDVEPNGTGVDETKLKQLGEIKARAGFASGPVLIFVNGGPTFAAVSHRYDADADSAPSVSKSERKTGWSIGVGMEYMFAPNWSAKLEYDYVSLGKKSAVDITPKVSTKWSDNIDVVKVGINYHFNL